MNTRPVEEIQRAHDLLVPVLLGEVPNPFETPESKRYLHCAADVLCWILQHDHNLTFGENLEKLETGLKELGFQLNNHGN